MSHYDYRYTSDGFIPSIELKLFYCGSEQCAPGHSWGPALKDHYKFLYIHSGRGIYRVGERTYELGPGGAFLLSPDVVAYYRADEQDPWTYSWVAFDGINAGTYLRLARLSPFEPVVQCRQPEAFELIFRHIYEACQLKVSSGTRLLSHLYALLSLLIEQAEAGHAPAKMDNPQETYVKKAIEFVHINYSQTVTIAEMADWIGLERKYLSKLFKQATGLSPQDYLIQFRMNKACELMGNPSLSIGEIAGSVGYKDPLLFSKMFKKLNGVSPTEYRKSS
ncbi:AraC family transcriptional regulator [Paenibacillus thalictri]|uniref:AraC family transcriptional regulator n=1 Tax=Paenibacillus thalictri TaxID=2527873 RepID=A0A4Q9DYX0_9BACL|nr:AraC family transcriptional regulator [Paenibacillus thalictri]TBL80440.1 AraC family transcriptional regulator [Paenibacillus thalictri]